MAKSTHPEARIFFVETHFHEMARRPGGVPREQAIERAEAEIDEIKPEFVDWLDGELKDFSKLITDARTGQADPGWVSVANFRCRQLRDTGTTMGFELLSFVADSLCELLDSIAAGGECNMDSIMCHVDALMLSRQEGYRHLQPEQVPDLTRGLRRVARSKGA